MPEWVSNATYFQTWVKALVGATGAEGVATVISNVSIAAMRSMQLHRSPIRACTSVRRDVTTPASEPHARSYRCREKQALLQWLYRDVAPTSQRHSFSSASPSWQAIR